MAAYVQREHALPEPEDWTKLTLRQKAGYFLVRRLSKLTQLIWLYIIQEPVWRSADGVCTPISKLDTEHLRNIVRMLCRKGEAERPLTECLMQELSRRPASRRPHYSRRNQQFDPDGQ
jgi:hypothetical protein